MKVFTSLKTACWLLLISLLAFQFISCQKQLSDEGAIIPPTTPVDLTTKVSSSISGFVTDENDLPVQSASVKIGTRTVSTDKYGFFEVRNEQVVKNAGTVTVNSTGYFPGIRTFMAEEN